MILYALDGIVILLALLMGAAEFILKNQKYQKIALLVAQILIYACTVGAIVFLIIMASGDKQYGHLFISILWLRISLWSFQRAIK